MLYRHTPDFTDTRNYSYSSLIRRLTQESFNVGTQTLTWDAFGRLLKVTERDAQTNGFNWAAVYDGSGRRLRTTTTMVLTNVLVTSPASADPRHIHSLPIQSDLSR